MMNSNRFCLNSYSTNKEYFNTIRENILVNFLHRYYKFTVVCNRGLVVEDLKNRSPFFVKYDESTDILTMQLSDNEHLTFKFVWEEKNFGDQNNQFLLKNIE